MNIISRGNETLDVILSNCQKYTKEFVKQRLEQYDRDIYCCIDRNRFRLIRIDERTILTTLGIIKYKHRYYFDSQEEQYVYLLDNQLGIPKNIRMSNELIIKIIELASVMTYAEVGRHLSNEFTLSKFTIWKVIHNTLIESIYTREIKRDNLKVHVQIDEKFINMSPIKKRDDKVAVKNKRRYYTLTIFAGKKKIGNKNKYQLLNKTVISSSQLDELKRRLNIILKERYKVTIDEEIFISGDFASYIQRFKEDVFVCKCKYVPDKFHVYKAIKDSLPDLWIDDYSLNNKNFQKYLVNQLSKIENDDARKVKNLIKRDKNCFSPYLDHEYLGCSQEGQNSNIYAPRFGKRGNRFNPSTIEKLSLIREAVVMDCDIKIRPLHEKKITRFDIGIIASWGDYPYKDALNTSVMKYETKCLFDRIKYGVPVK